jgi:hypothetical protein
MRIVCLLQVEGIVGLCGLGMLGVGELDGVYVVYRMDRES